MVKVRAWERLNDTDYSGRLTTVEFYNLLLEAGFTEDVAQKAASQRGLERLSAGEMI